MGWQGKKKKKKLLQVCLMGPVLHWHLGGVPCRWVAGKAKLEVQRLTTDNLTLYEKIRFLEH